MFLPAELLTLPRIELPCWPAVADSARNSMPARVTSAKIRFFITDVPFEIEGDYSSGSEFLNGITYRRCVIDRWVLTQVRFKLIGGSDALAALLVHAGQVQMHEGE